MFTQSPSAIFFVMLAVEEIGRSRGSVRKVKLFGGNVRNTAQSARSAGRRLPQSPSTECPFQSWPTYHFRQTHLIPLLSRRIVPARLYGAGAASPILVNNVLDFRLSNPQQKAGRWQSRTSVHMAVAPITTSLDGCDIWLVALHEAGCCLLAVNSFGRRGDIGRSHSKGPEFAHHVDL